MVRLALAVAAAAGFLLAAGCTVLLYPVLCRVCFARPRRYVGPGTNKPTMGGLGLLFGLAAGCQLALVGIALLEPTFMGGNQRQLITLALCCGAGFALTGFVDDFCRLKWGRKLRTVVRLAAQAVVVTLFLTALRLAGAANTAVALPGLGVVELGVLYYVGAYPAFLCAGLGFSAAEPAEGLCSWAGFLGALCLLAACALQDRFQLAVLPAALAGAVLAFLLWNMAPARLLLGGVGSQLLAGLLVALCYVAGQPGLALWVCGGPLVEGGCLLLQRLWLAVRKKPLLLKAPLHALLVARGNEPARAALWLYGVHTAFAVLGMLFLRLYL